MEGNMMDSGRRRKNPRHLYMDSSFNRYHPGSSTFWLFENDHNVFIKEQLSSLLNSFQR